MFPTIVQAYIESSNIPLKCQQYMNNMKIFAEKRGWNYKLELIPVSIDFQKKFEEYLRLIETWRINYLSENENFIFVDWDAELYENFEYIQNNGLHCDFVNWENPNGAIIYGSTDYFKKMIEFGKKRGLYNISFWTTKILRWYRSSLKVQEIPKNQYVHEYMNTLGKQNTGYLSTI